MSNNSKKKYSILTEQSEARSGGSLEVKTPIQTQILGLTGSIGMGKTTVAAQLTRRGDALADADALVHHLLKPGGAAFAEVTAAFPACLENGKIDRKKLGAIVFADRTKLKQLEKILHPKVRAAMKALIRRATAQRRKRVILEIPLLFETGAETICDHVIVVTAPAFIQRQRVLARPNMTEEKFREILAFQLPDREKRKRADTVIPTGLGRAFSRRQLNQAKINNRPLPKLASDELNARSAPPQNRSVHTGT